VAVRAGTRHNFGEQPRSPHSDGHETFRQQFGTVAMIDSKDKRLISRRQFNELCVAIGSAISPLSGLLATLSSGPTVAATSGDFSNQERHTVKFPNGTIVPAVGQGSWHLAQGRHPEAVEEEALRIGLSLGMTLIDTAEMYSDGRSEQMIGRVIEGQRDRVFLVSKVLPNHTAEDGIAHACEGSLARLGTDYLDLYLLHWRDRGIDLSGVVAGFEKLRAANKIRAWGVSDFKVSDMEDLFRVPDGHRYATNQVRYNLDSRGIEYELLPWCEQHGIPVMAYSPLGGNGLVGDPTLAQIGAAHGCSAAAVALAWAIRSGNVIAIPESGSLGHVRENAVALSLTLTPQEIETLNAAHPIRAADFLGFVLDHGRRWLPKF
jgi:diketogulonate reductase-like aldo/keto reductase